MKTDLSLIIADDHPVVRRGIRQIIEAEEPDLNIVAECDDGAEALTQIIALRPDIALLDIDMPKMDGLAVLRALQERKIPCRIIFLTVHNDENLFKNALRLGAQGYVIKDSAAEDIVKAIRTVVKGENYASPALTTFLFKQTRDVSTLGGLESLSAAERRVLRLVANYQTNSQIADTLSISQQTVKTHRRNIAHKLGIEGRHALMKYALENKSSL